ncbi:MAG: hypothetical protein ACPHQP_07875 [Longimicrobiales bacterium]
MFFYAHSGFRYLVLLMGVVVIGYAAYGLVTKAEYGKPMRVLSAIFTGVMDLTVLLGLIVLFTGTFYPQLGGHIVMMILATVIAHAVHGVMKRRPPEAQTFTPHIVGTVAVLACVVAGIMAIGRNIVG